MGASFLVHSKHFYFVHSIVFLRCKKKPQMRYRARAPKSMFEIEYLVVRWIGWLLSWTDKVLQNGLFLGVNDIDLRFGRLYLK